jgi:hypothetical protein
MIDSAIRIATVILLVFVAVTAFFGGMLFIRDPSGMLLQMDVTALGHSPFADYLIPGIVLLSILGIGSGIVAALVIVRAHGMARSVMALGGALVVWIAVQLLMIRQTHAFQAVFAGIGVLLCAFGWRLQNTNRPVRERRRPPDADP